ncbi:RDD family protein [Peribacillus glennii]|nr:RDD family protein [Peribacillus glennii]
MSEPAGFWRRLGANLLDGVLFLIVGIIISLLINDRFVNTEPYVNVLSFLYTLLLPVFWSGFTVGKRMLGIRITKKDGRNVSFGNMFMRTFMAGILYALPILISFIIIAFTADDAVVELLFGYDSAIGDGGDMVGVLVPLLIGLGLSGILLLISALMIGVRNDKRSIHDFIAGTVVVYGQGTETR